jgi:hypothetical protein
MDLGFDPKVFQQAMRQGRGVPDWSMLRARFEAAAATRGMLCSLTSRSTAAISPRRGSFDAATARAVAGFAESTLNVNPTALANGNSGYDNNAAAAGANSAGD